MAQPSWAPEGVDVNRPSSARTRDFVLEDSTDIIAALRDAVAPGSHLSSTMTSDARPQRMAEGMGVITQHGGFLTMPHSRAEMERLCAGPEPVESGPVWSHERRPDAPKGPAKELDRQLVLSRVGRKT